MDEPRLGGFLYAVPAGMLQMFKEELIYPQRFLTFIGHDTEMLI